MARPIGSTYHTIGRDGLPGEKQVVHQEHETGRKFHVWIDNVEYVLDHESVTGAELKAIAGIPADIPLLLLNEDGSEETIRDDETIDLKPGRRFAKAPRFRRG